MEIEPIVGLTYAAIGFVLTYLSLEAAWHFTACKIKIANENIIKPCLFKQVKMVAVATTRHKHR
jgi:hypothetical protein